MTTSKNIFVYGASGHAKVVIDIIERQGHHQVGYLVDDDPALWGKDFFGYPVIGGREKLLSVKNEVAGGMVAIGSNQARIVVVDWLIENSFEFVSAIHPSAVISRNVTIGHGTVLMAGAVVNADTVVGDQVIINTGATVDHDCIIGRGCHIAPGASLCGTVHVGEGSFVCAGATVAPNVRIGDRSVVGAGATVLQDIADDTTVVGTPAAQL